MSKTIYDIPEEVLELIFTLVNPPDKMQWLFVDKRFSGAGVKLLYKKLEIHTDNNKLLSTLTTTSLKNPGQYTRYVTILGMEDADIPVLNSLIPHCPAVERIFLKLNKTFLHTGQWKAFYRFLRQQHQEVQDAQQQEHQQPGGTVTRRWRIKEINGSSIHENWETYYDCVKLFKQYMDTLHLINRTDYASLLAGFNTITTLHVSGNVTKDVRDIGKVLDHLHNLRHLEVRFKVPNSQNVIQRMINWEPCESERTYGTIRSLKLTNMTLCCNNQLTFISSRFPNLGALNISMAFPEEGTEDDCWSISKLDGNIISSFLNDYISSKKIDFDLTLFENDAATTLSALDIFGRWMKVKKLNMSVNSPEYQEPSPTAFSLQIGSTGLDLDICIFRQSYQSAKEFLQGAATVMNSLGFFCGHLTYYHLYTAACLEKMKWISDVAWFKNWDKVTINGGMVYDEYLEELKDMQDSLLNFNTRFLIIKNSLISTKFTSCFFKLFSGVKKLYLIDCPYQDLLSKWNCISLEGQDIDLQELIIKFKHQGWEDKEGKHDLDRASVESFTANAYDTKVKRRNICLEVNFEVMRNGECHYFIHDITGFCSRFSTKERYMTEKAHIIYSIHDYVDLVIQLKSLKYMTIITPFQRIHLPFNH